MTGKELSPTLAERPEAAMKEPWRSLGGAWAPQAAGCGSASCSGWLPTVASSKEWPAAQAGSGGGSAAAEDALALLGGEGLAGRQLEGGGPVAAAAPIGVSGAPDRPFGVGAVGQRDRLPSLDQALAEYAEVPPVTAVLLHAPQQVGALPAVGDLVTGSPRLADLDDRTADLVDVAEADAPLVLAADREVLAEPARPHLLDAQLSPPVRVMVRGVAEDGHLGTSVDAGVSLAVALDVGRAKEDRAGDRALEDGALPLVIDGLRQAHVAPAQVGLADLDGAQARAHTSGPITSTSLPSGSST